MLVGLPITRLSNCILYPPVPQGRGKEIHTIGGTLGNRPLATTASYANAVDNIALLGLVAETTSLVGAGRTGSAVNSIQLTELY